MNTTAADRDAARYALADAKLALAMAKAREIETKTAHDRAIDRVAATQADLRDARHRYRNVIGHRAP